MTNGKPCTKASILGEARAAFSSEAGRMGLNHRKTNLICQAEFRGCSAEATESNTALDPSDGVSLPA